MARSYRRGALLLSAVVGLGAWKAAWPAAPNLPEAPAPEQTVNVALNGVKYRCRMLHAWKLPTGGQAYHVQAANGAEVFTLVHDAGNAAQGKETAVRIYRWNNPRTSPPGAPVPPGMTASAPAPTAPSLAAKTVTAAAPAPKAAAAPIAAPKTVAPPAPTTTLTNAPTAAPKTVTTTRTGWMPRPGTEPARTPTPAQSHVAAVPPPPATAPVAASPRVNKTTVASAAPAPTGDALDQSPWAKSAAATAAQPGKPSAEAPTRVAKDRPPVTPAAQTHGGLPAPLPILPPTAEFQARAMPTPPTSARVEEKVVAGPALPLPTTARAADTPPALFPLPPTPAAPIAPVDVPTPALAREMPVPVPLDRMPPPVAAAKASSEIQQVTFLQDPPTMPPPDLTPATAPALVEAPPPAPPVSAAPASVIPASVPPVSVAPASVAPASVAPTNTPTELPYYDVIAADDAQRGTGRAALAPRPHPERMTILQRIRSAFTRQAAVPPAPAPVAVLVEAPPPAPAAPGLPMEEPVAFAPPPAPAAPAIPTVARQEPAFVPPPAPVAAPPVAAPPVAAAPVAAAPAPAAPSVASQEPAFVPPPTPMAPVSTMPPPVITTPENPVVTAGSPKVDPAPIEPLPPALPPALPEAVTPTFTAVQPPPATEAAQPAPREALPPVVAVQPSAPTEPAAPVVLVTPGAPAASAAPCNTCATAADSAPCAACATCATPTTTAGPAAAPAAAGWALRGRWTSPTVHAGRRATGSAVVQQPMMDQPVAAGETVGAPAASAHHGPRTGPGVRDDSRDFLGWLLTQCGNNGPPPQQMLNAFTPAPPAPPKVNPNANPYNAFVHRFNPNPPPPPMPQMPQWNPYAPGPAGYGYPLPPLMPPMYYPQAVPAGYTAPPGMVQQIGFTAATPASPTARPANFAMDRPASFGAGAQAADPGALVKVMQTLKDSPHPYEREQAANDLASFDWRAHPNVLTALTHAAVNDPAGSVRAACVHQLGRMRVPASMTANTLQSLRDDPDVRVRFEVATVLGEGEPTRRP